MEALVIYLILVASVFASAALSWWVSHYGYGHLGHAAALKHGAPRSLKAAAAGQESPNESKKESTK